MKKGVRSKFAVTQKIPSRNSPRDNKLAQELDDSFNSDKSMEDQDQN